MPLGFNLTDFSKLSTLNGELNLSIKGKTITDDDAKNIWGKIKEQVNSFSDDDFVEYVHLILHDREEVRKRNECVFEGCNRPKKPGFSGSRFCYSHYYAWKENIKRLNDSKK